ncbi:hypothetical protein GOSPT_128_00080 [Gordonia sputi NBRC 100414]|uniref:Uncharacterized protein n=1 Tax=Gordonia sputi NBRC 100414 TaxID=1089453 RepID=H5U6I5_9ACTN|nr:hypothetical protein GOSPT_128_00080 [Gordonia sputi NBRC 100414]
MIVESIGNGPPPEAWRATPTMASASTSADPVDTRVKFDMHPPSASVPVEMLSRAEYLKRR